MIHTHEIRVRYGETDQMGVVHHSVHALYFEESRTEFMRSLGYPYARLEEEGLFLPVVELQTRYRGGASYDDVVRVKCRVGGVARVRLKLEYRVEKKSDDSVLAEGHTLHACTDREFRPMRLPAEVSRIFEGLVRTGDWEE